MVLPVLEIASVVLQRTKKTGQDQIQRIGLFINPFVCFHPLGGKLLVLLGKNPGGDNREAGNGEAGSDQITLKAVS